MSYFKLWVNKSNKCLHVGAWRTHRATSFLPLPFLPPPFLKLSSFPLHPYWVSMVFCIWAPNSPPTASTPTASSSFTFQASLKRRVLPSDCSCPCCTNVYRSIFKLCIQSLCLAETSNCLQLVNPRKPAAPQEAWEEVRSEHRLQQPSELFSLAREFMFYFNSFALGCLL